jgi:hypothetical protein
MSKNGRPHLAPLEALKIAIRMRRQCNYSPWGFPGCGASGHIEEPKKALSTLLTREDQGVPHPTTCGARIGVGCSTLAHRLK